MPHLTSSERQDSGSGDPFRATTEDLNETSASTTWRQPRTEAVFLLRPSDDNDEPDDYYFEGDEEEGDRPVRWSTWRKSTSLLALLRRVAAGASVGPVIESLRTGGWLFRPSRRTLQSDKNKHRWIRTFGFLLLLFFSMIGIIKSVGLLYGIAISFFSEDFVQTWGGANGLTRWPTDATRDILPVACHSHNDYWRAVPLLSAVKAGCISVEADVWLVDEELYVGHSKSAIVADRTLHSLYVNPLVDMLSKQNPITPFHPENDQPAQGVFDTDPNQSLVLLIDFKTEGSATFPYVVSHLSPLRDRGYLTHWNGVEVINGPVTVVATGNAPFDILTANSTYRDIFFDAPLDMMEDGASIPLHRRGSTEDQGQGHSGTPSVIGSDTYNPSNSYYASVSFKKSIGYPWHFHITSDQLSRIRAQVNGAHRRGLKVRYWGTPSWPRSLRNYIWSILEREGVDVLNVDDLKGATSEDWRHRVSDWWF